MNRDFAGNIRRVYGFKADYIDQLKLTNRAVPYSDVQLNAGYLP